MWGYELRCYFQGGDGRSRGLLSHPHPHLPLIPPSLRRPEAWRGVRPTVTNGKQGLALSWCSPAMGVGGDLQHTCSFV